MNNEKNKNNTADADQQINANSTNDKTEIDELEKCRKQVDLASGRADEYLNNWKRERADFINYKKDEGKRLEEFVKFANEGLILEFLDIVDDLELAAKHEANMESIKQIVKKTSELLKKYNVERIKTDGQFNPELHEAISTTEFLDPLKQGQETTPGEESGDKIEEIRAGYTMHGRIIRSARVKIIK